MPRELVALAPRTPALVEYEPPELGPGMVRVQSELGAPKHGTELKGYRNDAAFTLGEWYREWRCYRPRPAARSPFPLRLGNMIAGRVTGVGAGVSGLRPGDRVYGRLPLRDVHVVRAEAVTPLPPDLTPEAAVCVDLALTRFGGSSALSMPLANGPRGRRPALSSAGSRRFRSRWVRR